MCWNRQEGQLQRADRLRSGLPRRVIETEYRVDMQTGCSRKGCFRHTAGNRGGPDICQKGVNSSDHNLER